MATKKQNPLKIKDTPGFISVFKLEDITSFLPHEIVPDIKRLCEYVGLDISSYNFYCGDMGPVPEEDHRNNREFEYSIPYSMADMLLNTYSLRFLTPVNITSLKSDDEGIGSTNLDSLPFKDGDVFEGIWHAGNIAESLDRLEKYLSNLGRRTTHKERFARKVVEISHPAY